MDERKAYIFPLPTNGDPHSIIKLPSKIPNEDPEKKSSGEDTFTLVMIDVSGSMHSYWSNLLVSWREHLAPNIEGLCHLYVFGSDVEFIRSSAKLQDDDFKCSGTDLTGALRTINNSIQERKESLIRVILVTDGGHNATEEKPDSVIKLMKTPKDKTVEVYILGIGNCFPVQYSLDIRSLLHNGSTNIPYLYWAKEKLGVEDQVVDIKEQLVKFRAKISASTPGQLCPYNDDVLEFNLSEWVYYKKPASELMELKFTINEDTLVENVFGDKISLNALTSDIFSQWNKVILQTHRNKKNVDMKIFELMDEIINLEVEKLDTKDKESMSKIQKRLHEKNLKKIKTDYATIVNQSKRLIDNDAKFSRETELADLVLKATSSGGKYNLKAMEMKGHTMEDFQEDLQVFIGKYNHIKDKIDKLPEPSNDDCCRVTATCTIMDLKDPSFSDIFQENKFDFLKVFAISGIPVLIKMKDSLEINSWTIHIDNILVNPFAVLSQQALEYDGAELRETDQSALLKKDDENTRFNGIVPVFPKGTVESIKPLLTTKIYSMCCTFSILKSVHILDFNCHIAALGCVWLRTIHDFPKLNRPAFINDRLEMIEETCKIYIDRKGLKTYVETLLDKPSIALMTENSEHNIKCESILKPLFLLHIYKASYEEKFKSMKFNILKLLLLEFVGRCLSSFKQNTESPFSSTFMENYQEKTDEIKKNMKLVISRPYVEQGDNLFKQYYTPEEMKTETIKKLKLSMNDEITNGLKSFGIKLDEKKIKELKNSGSCGDVSWGKIKSWANEMDFAESEINKLFGEEMSKLYFYHSIKYPGSKNRMETEILTDKTVDDLITQQIIKENSYSLRSDLINELPGLLEVQWMKDYEKTHCEIIVSPMTKESISKKASELGIDVSAETFNKIYKYRENVGLLRNACMSEICPHFLQPRKDFNQHVSIERRYKAYPHNLHNVTSINTSKSAEEILALVKTEPLKRSNLAGKDQFKQDFGKNLDNLVQSYKKIKTVA